MVKTRVVAGYGSPPVILSHFMTTKRFRGVSTLNDEDYSAPTTGGPVKTWFWDIFAQELGSGLAIQFFYDVVITYYVKFFKRREFSPS